jgi:hypothetical protein
MNEREEYIIFVDHFSNNIVICLKLIIELVDTNSDEK